MNAQTEDLRTTISDLIAKSEPNKISELSNTELGFVSGAQMVCTKYMTGWTGSDGTCNEKPDVVCN
jgi:hypothetical protein